MSLAADLRARLTVAEETDGPVLLLPVEARAVLAVIEAAQEAFASVEKCPVCSKAHWEHGRDRRINFGPVRAALAVVFADEKETP